MIIMSQCLKNFLLLSVFYFIQTGPDFLYGEENQKYLDAENYFGIGFGVGVPLPQYTDHTPHFQTGLEWGGRYWALSTLYSLVIDDAPHPWHIFGITPRIQHFMRLRIHSLELGVQLTTLIRWQIYQDSGFIGISPATFDINFWRYHWFTGASLDGLNLNGSDSTRAIHYSALLWLGFVF